MPMPATKKEVDMDADRQGWHDVFCRHEQALQNGKHDDAEYKNTVLIDMCRLLRVLIATDFVKAADLANVCKGCKPGPWPKTMTELAGFIALIASVCATAVKIFT